MDETTTSRSPEPPATAIDKPEPRAKTADTEAAAPAGDATAADTAQSPPPPSAFLPPVGNEPPVEPSTPASTASSSTTRLRRSRSNRMIAGVCGGFAEVLGIDATILRLALVLATVLGFGAGVVLYIACWILMPEED
ncbi:MAG: PspC domain-containing protein [Pseudonocardia sp.]|nr:PspC domain-containing protein [Pseudonocardia sp.]